MTINVTFDSLEEVRAFAEQFHGPSGTGGEVPGPAPDEPAASADRTVPTAHAAQTGTPAVQDRAVPASVPTTVASYTLDDLARAGMTLMDSGRQGELLQLLNRFGVDALPALPQAQYGAFATALREMGAQI